MSDKTATQGMADDGLKGAPDGTNQAGQGRGGGGDSGGGPYPNPHTGKPNSEKSFKGGQTGAAYRRGEPLHGERQDAEDANAAGP
jgi:hypothetical protein